MKTLELSAQVTLEDSIGLEIEVETVCGSRLITVNKKGDFKQGDIVRVLIVPLHGN
jgi:hypothetical protein